MAGIVTGEAGLPFTCSKGCHLQAWRSANDKREGVGRNLSCNADEDFRSVYKQAPYVAPESGVYWYLPSCGLVSPHLFDC